MTTKRNLSSYDGKLALEHMPDRLIPASSLTPYVPTFTVYGSRAPGEVVDTFAGSAGALDAGWLNVGTCSWERDGSGNLWAISGTGKNWVLRDAGSEVTPIRAVVERTPVTSSGLVVFGDVTGANNLELSITALGQWQLRARISGSPTTLNTSFHGVIAAGTIIDITRTGTVVRFEFDGALANGGEVDLANVSGVDYSACLAGQYAGFTNGGSPVSGTTAKWSLWQAGFLDATYDGCDWYDLTTNTLYRDYDASATTFAETVDVVPTASLTTKLGSTYQPLDSDLTAIAALTTTSYGRAFLALADAAAGRTALGLGSIATAASTAYEPTNVIRIPAAGMSSAQGSPTLGPITGPAGARIQGWALDPTTQEAVGASVWIPSDWTTYDVSLTWVDTGAPGGAARFQFGSKPFSDTVIVNTGGAAASGADYTRPAQYETDVVTLTTGVSATAGWTAVAVTRVAANAGDTIANDVNVLALVLTKAS